MARDEDAGHFEWVNAWASAPAVAAPAKAAPAAAPVPPAAPRYIVTGSAEATTIAPGIEGESTAPRSDMATAAPPPDQLMRDIAEIERARDALAGGAIGQRMRAFMLVPSRTADTTPLMIGGILALAMLTVFGAAAAVSKFTVR